jgi:prepilin-type N-terminal cleavage/methylation domain-containing protein
MNSARVFRGSRRGFTLIEVLVSLMILGLAVTAIIRLFSANLRNIAASDVQVVSVAKAESRLREALETGKLEEGLWSEVGQDGFSAEFQVDEVLREKTYQLPYKLLDVRASFRWSEGGITKSCRLRTMKLVERDLVTEIK